MQAEIQTENGEEGKEGQVQRGFKTIRRASRPEGADGAIRAQSAKAKADAYRAARRSRELQRTYRRRGALRDSR